MGDSGAPKDQDNATEDKSNSPNSDAFSGVPSITENPLTPSQACSPHHHLNPTPSWKRLATWQFVAEIAIFIVGVRVAFIYSGQLQQMIDGNRMTQESLELTRKLVKGTYSAIVTADIGFDGNDSTVNVAFVNHGKAITNTVANYEIVQESLPDEKLLKFDRHYTVSDSIVREGEGPNHYYVIEGFTKEDLAAYKASREGIKVTGKFRYDDGFGETVTRDFCLITTAFGRFPCDGLARYIHSLPH